MTATINSGQTTQCAQAAGTPTGATAGNCADTSTYTYTGTTTVTPSINADRGTILAGQLATLTVTGTPGDHYNVVAANRPSSTFVLARQGILGANGTSSFTVHPLNNVNFKAVDGSLTSAQIIIAVHTGLKRTCGLSSSPSTKHQEGPVHQDGAFLVPRRLAATRRGRAGPRR